MAQQDKSETKETFTVITTEPSKFAAQFHNRMPLILEPDTWDTWLKGDPDAAAALMKPANEDLLLSRPVNKAVGNVKNNGPELLETPGGDSDNIAYQLTGQDGITRTRRAWAWRYAPSRREGLALLCRQHSHEQFFRF